ncbi:hypothetical protein [Pontibacter litorisediminis]|uniref:hypothetical protein n=1 Tax=Pontibacter litorisediminis TaxID=1846260 RepID=UPI0023EAFE3D|nr:hypothetical protein [Pontibacter litorisediminis]
MSPLLISQQIELTYHEAYGLCAEIYSWLSRPIDQNNKLQPSEVLAAAYLQSAAKKITRRMYKKAGPYKITFTAQEIIAVDQIINYYPVELYSVLSKFERKALNYDQLIALHCG